jgi:hypothetical protein
MATITGTNNFVSFWKAVAYYSRPVPASSSRDIIQEVKDKIAEGDIVIGEPELRPGERLIVIDNYTRYAIEESTP